MRALRIENEQLRQRLERMERRVRGGDASPSSSPRPPVTVASPAAKTIASPVSHRTETAVQKRSRKRSADTGADRPQLPEMKIIKLEMPSAPTTSTTTDLSLSRRLHSYAGSEFLLDNLTDEIFAESDESFTSPTGYPASACSERPANGVGSGDADSRLMLNHKRDHKQTITTTATPTDPSLGRGDEQEELKGALLTPATTTAARKKSSQKVLTSDKGGGATAKLSRKGAAGRRSGRLPSRPSITVSVSGRRI